LQTFQGVTLETLRAIVFFIDKYADRLGPVVKSGSRRQMDQLITELDELAIRQATNATVLSGAEKAKELRQDLVEKHMKPIVQIASVDLPRTPELAKLRVPKGSPTPEKLVKAAEQMRELAAPHAQTFIDAGLPETFLADLTAAAAAFMIFSAKRKGSAGTGKAATSGIKEGISRATRIVKALDGLVLKQLDRRSPDDQLLRAEWAFVKKVRKTASRPGSVDPLPIPPAEGSVAQASAGGGA
jgi:hypothetical protein